MNVELLGHVGYVLIVIGLWLIGRGRGIGWLLHAWGCALWVGIGIQLGVIAMWSWSLVFVVVGLRNWHKTTRSQPDEL